MSRGSESPSGGQPAVQTCGFPLPVTSHGGNSRKAIFKTGRVRSIARLDHAVNFGFYDLIKEIDRAVMEEFGDTQVD